MQTPIQKRANRTPRMRPRRLVLESPSSASEQLQPALVSTAETRDAWAHVVRVENGKAEGTRMNGGMEETPVREKWAGVAAREKVAMEETSDSERREGGKALRGEKREMEENALAEKRAGIETATAAGTCAALIGEFEHRRRSMRSQILQERQKSGRAGNRELHGKKAAAQSKGGALLERPVKGQVGRKDETKIIGMQTGTTHEVHEQPERERTELKKRGMTGETVDKKMAAGEEKLAKPVREEAGHRGRGETDLKEGRAGREPGVTKREKIKVTLSLDAKQFMQRIQKKPLYRKKWRDKYERRQEKEKKMRIEADAALELVTLRAEAAVKERRAKEQMELKKKRESAEKEMEKKRERDEAERLNRGEDKVEGKGRGGLRRRGTSIEVNEMGETKTTNGRKEVRNGKKCRLEEATEDEEEITIEQETLREGQMIAENASGKGEGRKSIEVVTITTMKEDMSGREARPREKYGLTYDTITPEEPAVERETIREEQVKEKNKKLPVGAIETEEVFGVQPCVTEDAAAGGREMMELGRMAKGAVAVGGLSAGILGGLRVGIAIEGDDATLQSGTKSGFKHGGGLEMPAPYYGRCVECVHVPYRECFCRSCNAAFDR